MLSVGTAGSSWGCLAIESVVCCLFPLRSTSEGWWEWLSVYGWQLTSDGGMARLRAKPSMITPPEHAGCLTHSPAAVGRIDMIASRSCCRFVVCTSMMRISRSTASQRCSIGLRSGDCGGHLSKVNSLSCSRNQSEMIWALWHGALSCWKYIRRWYTVDIKGWTWSATILR